MSATWMALGAGAVVLVATNGQGMSVALAAAALVLALQLPSLHGETNYTEAPDAPEASNTPETPHKGDTKEDTKEDTKKDTKEDTSDLSEWCTDMPPPRKYINTPPPPLSPRARQRITEDVVASLRQCHKK